jgi:hypothetical protein
LGGDISEREVVHALIKSNMEGNFYSISLRVEPEDVLCGVGEKTEKHATLGMILQSTVSLSGRTCPDTATKSSKISEISLQTIVQSLMVRRTVVFAGESILDAQEEVECVGPKTRFQV